MLDPGVLEFVRALSLPPPPARVLEVGAGSGELAPAPAPAGATTSVAIDPSRGRTRRACDCSSSTVAEPEASFDAAVAVVSLHHVEPFGPSCRRLAEVVRPGGTLVVDELDVDALDERAVALVAGAPRRPSAIEHTTGRRGRGHARAHPRADAR